MSLSILLLALANGLGISVAVISVTISALSAKKIGIEEQWMSIPYGIQFLAVLIIALANGKLIPRYGRKKIFLTASVSNLAAGLVGFLALNQGSFLLLCLAHILIGINLGTIGFYRFAAFAMAKEKDRSLAVSMIIFGGTFAAFLGPYLARNTDEILKRPTFESAYLAISFLSVIVLAVLSITKIPRPDQSDRFVKEKQKTDWSSDRLNLWIPKVWGGIISCSLGFGVMNFLMISSSISMERHGISYELNSYAIQYHLMAMFIPSIFMGKLSDYIGASKIVLIGLGMLFLCVMTSVLNLNLDPLTQFIISLLFLGIAWNMLYLGGSLIVAKNTPKKLTFEFQALNDFLVGLFSMIGAFLPSFMLNLYGWRGINQIALGIIMVCSLVILYSLSARANQRSKLDYSSSQKPS